MKNCGGVWMICQNDHDTICHIHRKAARRGSTTKARNSVGLLAVGMTNEHFLKVDVGLMKTYLVLEREIVSLPKVDPSQHVCCGSQSLYELDFTSIHKGMRTASTNIFSIPLNGMRTKQRRGGSRSKRQAMVDYRRKGTVCMTQSNRQKNLQVKHKK